MIFVCVYVPSNVRELETIQAILDAHSVPPSVWPLF